MLLVAVQEKFRRCLIVCGPTWGLSAIFECKLSSWYAIRISFRVLWEDGEDDKINNDDKSIVAPSGVVLVVLLVPEVALGWNHHWIHDKWGVLAGLPQSKVAIHCLLVEVLSGVLGLMGIFLLREVVLLGFALWVVTLCLWIRVAIATLMLSASSLSSSAHVSLTGRRRMVLFDRNMDILDRSLDLGLQQVIISLKGLIRSILCLCSILVLFSTLRAVRLTKNLINWNLMCLSFSSGDQRSSDNRNWCFSGISMRISVNIVEVCKDRNCYFCRGIFILIFIVRFLMEITIHVDGIDGLGDHNSDWGSIICLLIRAAVVAASIISFRVVIWDLAVPASSLLIVSKSFTSRFWVIRAIVWGRPKTMWVIIGLNYLPKGIAVINITGLGKVDNAQMRITFSKFRTLSFLIALIVLMT